MKDTLPACLESRLEKNEQVHLQALVSSPQLTNDLIDLLGILHLGVQAQICFQFACCITLLAYLNECCAKIPVGFYSILAPNLCGPLKVDLCIAIVSEAYQGLP